MRAVPAKDTTIPMPTASPMGALTVPVLTPSSAKLANRLTSTALVLTAHLRLSRPCEEVPGALCATLCPTAEQESN